MKYTYDECLREIMTQVKRYVTYRQQKLDDFWELQSIRDIMSESLLFFGPFYADLRANAEQAEMERKLAYNDRKTYWKEQFKVDGKIPRGSADAIESNVMDDIKDYYQKEVDTNREYYKARVLMERADQELNSISSRLKALMKNNEQKN
jgi:hypothetical protein